MATSEPETSSSAQSQYVDGSQGITPAPTASTLGGERVSGCKVPNYTGLFGHNVDQLDLAELGEHPVPSRATTSFCFQAVWVFAASLCWPANAGEPAAVLPKDTRVESIQTPEEFFGFAMGSRHLRHDQVTAYWNYLAENSNRVELIPYGRTHGMRPLMVAAITSPENLEQLKDIQRERPKLASGKFAGSLDAQKLVMYMGYSVHGDEASAVNAAPLVAYHLASSESDEVVAGLANSVFLVDPALNPDGVDRFANWANEARGKFASDSDVDREHVQAWPGGRTNYYWFDLNRDLLPATHPESQGRLRLFQQWRPNVVLDFHEMGGTSTYFFQPGIPARNNPLSPPKNLELTRKFAAEHAKSMDDAVELYFTEERFDDFYPGKGSTYPDLHGAVGILFEQGSTRGLKLKNETTNRHFRDTVANQVRTSLSSLRAAQMYRTELLALQNEFYAASLAAGRSDPTSAYILSGSPSRIHAAATLLRRHAIKVYQPENEIRLESKSHAKGTVLVIPTAQAEYQFVRSFMEPLQSFRENIFYDVSTWHLPSAFDLEMHRFQSDLPDSWIADARVADARVADNNVADDAADAGRPASGSDLDADQRLAGFAFSPMELDAPMLVAKLQRAGASVRVATEDFVAEGKNVAVHWPPGTYLVLKQPNRERWERITEVAAASSGKSVAISPLPSSLTSEGPDLGSNSTLVLPRCTPLLVVGEGTSAYEAGAIWHFLDQRMHQPATLVDANRFSSVELDDYSCVILPGGTYGGWSKAEAEQLTSYVRRGGTVVAVTSSINWLRRFDLLAAEKAGMGEMDPTNESGLSPKPLFGDAASSRALESIAGAFLSVQIDPTHPMAYGFSDSEVPVFRDHASRFGVPSNPYQTVGTYTGVIAGYVSQRNRDRLASSAAVWVQPSGNGNFILLADNPVFRGYVRSSERFFTNAILLGPTLRIPSAPAAEEADAEDGHGH